LVTTATYGYDTLPGLFTAKERDAETGLDYFGARYFSSAQGRFTSPDPINHPAESEVGEEEFLSNPQRWNKYAYALNNASSGESVGDTGFRDARKIALQM